MNTIEHTAKPPVRKTPRFAVPFASPRATGSGAPSLRLLGLAALAAVALIALIASPASAKQIHVYKESFGTPCALGPCALGQLTEPSAVAVNEATGEVYVVDKGNSRVQIFNSAGAATGQFNGSAAPTGAFSEPTWIAIDNNPASPSFEDVYVSDDGHSVIDKFSPTGTYLDQIKEGEGGNPFGQIYGLATDPEGKVFVHQESKEIDTYTGAATNLFSGSCINPRSSKSGLAVDSENNLYVGTGNGNFVKLDSACNELIFAVGAKPSSAAAVDFTNDNVYVDQLTTVTRFSPEAEAFYPGITPPLGTQPITLDTFGSDHLTEGAGIAVNSSSPEKLVYVADKAAGEVRVFNEASIPDVTTQDATNVKAHSAVLHGTVNPASGGEVTSCRFAWGTTPALEEAPLDCDTPTLPDGNAPVSVTATLPTQPNTTYYFRLEAENANGLNKGEASETKHFTTPGPAAIEATFAADVAGDAATIAATIHLHGVPTTYRFEYGTTTSYGTTVPLPDGNLGSGNGEVQASQRLHELLSATAYHYRVTVRSELEPGLFEEFQSPDRTFTTQGAASPAPTDSRQWQLISPPDKHGGSIRPPSNVGSATMPAAEDGSAITYTSNAPLQSGALGYPYVSQTLSSRGADGWTSRVLSIPHNPPTGTSALIATEYRFFSQQLDSAVLQPWGPFDPGLSPEASEASPYLLSLGSCASSCYRPLVTAKPGYENSLPGFGGKAYCAAGSEVGDQRLCGPGFVAATPDLSHVVVESAAPLLPGAPTGKIDQFNRQIGSLYEWSAGNLSLVGVLPNGEPAPPEATTLGQGVNGVESGHQTELSENARNAISDNGRAFFSVRGLGGTVDLYMRDTTVDQTVHINSPEAGCGSCSGGSGYFKTASIDGSRVYFISPAKLTENAHSSSPGEPRGDLYQCKIIEEAGQLACQLTDLTPEPSGEPAKAEGSVLGASKDGTVVYFVATGTLAAAPNLRGDSPAPEQPNLFEWREGEGITFIATLAAKDRFVWEDFEIQAARVSSDGRWMTFMSERSLTGYDNHDAISGQPDAEVYLYDADSGQLACISCNPTGARPVGVKFATANNGNNKNPAAQGIAVGNNWDPEGWVAATLPQNSQRYQPRYLSDSGRLYFNSLDALDPGDSNSNWDVYEYQPPGVGPCSPSSPSFDPSIAGCLGLISAGTSGYESGFIDASSSGADAFFMTYSKLAPSDLDSAPDVYDAHECSTEVPCLPSPLPASPACEGDACQQPATPPIDPTPGSLTFSGAGNINEVTSKKKKKTSKKRHKHEKSKSHKRTAKNNRRTSR